MRRMTATMDPVVFFGAGGIVVMFCVVGGVWTEAAAELFQTIRQTVIAFFGWYYAIVITCILGLVLWLMLGRHGRVRLGPEDAEPRYNRLGWLAMLFSAGMGTGLVFWGVSEPLYHYADPFLADPESNAAAREAMRYSFFHWGLHPWAIYSLLGAAIAYFHFRKDLPMAPRSLLYPLIGDRIHGGWGKAVDILCTVGTLLGVSNSLGVGAMQINAGLAASFGADQSTTLQVSIIAIITLIATMSVVAGVKAGIQRLSAFNLGLAGALMLFVLLAGPTLYVVETFLGSTALYLQKLPQMSLFVSFTGSKDWQANWTFFYWGWWISWSPFVGIFIARISCGRTLREFIVSVLLVPTIGTFFWFSVFGGTALHGELFGAGALMADVQEDISVSLHALLGQLPFATVTQVLATVLVMIFFITSSDSGSLVDDMVTSGGHPNPPRIQRVFWATAEGAAAATLLLVGGLTAIQNVAITMGLPMSLVLILAGYSLVRSLGQETKQAEARQ